MDRVTRIQVTPQPPGETPPPTERSRKAPPPRASASASISHTSSGHNVSHHSGGASSPSLLRGSSIRFGGSAGGGSGGGVTITSLNEERPPSFEILKKMRDEYEEVDTNYFHGMRDIDAANIMVEQMDPVDLQKVCLELLRIVQLTKVITNEDNDLARNLTPSPLPDGSNSNPMPPSDGSLQQQITFSFNQTGSTFSGIADQSRSDNTQGMYVNDGVRRAMFLHPTFEVPSSHFAMSRTASLASLGNMSLQSIASRAPVRSTASLTKTEDEESGHKKFNQYVILSELGRGTQAKVKLAYDTTTMELRALRIIKRPSTIAVGSARNKLMANRFSRIEKEIAVMKRLRHRNLVRLYEVIDDPSTQKLYLVLQYIKHGKLADPNDGMFVKVVDEYLLLGYTRQLCAGLTYLHKRNIAHRDVKPDNILLGDANDVYLADFGVADFLAEAGDDSDTESNVVDESTESYPATLQSSPRIMASPRQGNWRRSSVVIPQSPDFGKASGMSSARAGRLTKGPHQTSFTSALGGFSRSPQPATGGAVGTPAFFAPEAINIPAPSRRRRSLFENAHDTQSIPSSPALAPSLALAPSGSMFSNLGEPATPPLNGCALDVWALGVSLFMMLCGRLPWITIDEDASDEQDRYWFNPQKYFVMVQFEEPMFPPIPRLLDDVEVTKRLFNFEERSEPLREQWISLLKSMMTKDPSKRPTMLEVRQEVKQMGRTMTPPAPPTGNGDEDEDTATQSRMSNTNKPPTRGGVMEDTTTTNSLARVPSFDLPDSEIEDAITHLVDFPFSIPAMGPMTLSRTGGPGNTTMIMTDDYSPRSMPPDSARSRTT